MNGTDFPPSDSERIRMRPHVADFSESMNRACYIAERDDVVAYINCFYPELRERVSTLFDPRNDWNTWVIFIGSSPILWTDKPIPGIAEQFTPQQTALKAFARDT
jgi:hypothetical protein